jgi:hypothetical protein
MGSFRLIPTEMLSLEFVVGLKIQARAPTLASPKLFTMYFALGE